MAKHALKECESCGKFLILKLFVLSEESGFQRVMHPLKLFRRVVSACLCEKTSAEIQDVYIEGFTQTVGSPPMNSLKKNPQKFYRC